MKDILVGYGVDVDAVAGWLGSYGGQDSPHDISRGVYAGEVGTPRLLRLFKKYGVRTSWFIPGHSIETFPTQMAAVAEAGHEIGLHGYAHENPRAMTPEQEEEVLLHSLEVVTHLAGQRPRGYVTPWWEQSAVTVDLLLRAGIRYDHSMGDNDFHPFYARVGRSWTPIDYSQPARAWMKPAQLGEESDLVEIGGNWNVDDLPPMMFNKNAANSYGFTSARVVEQTWRDQFDWVYREYDYAVFPFTIHPDVSGRPDVLLMHERLIEYMARQPGVRFVTLEEMADDFRARYPREQPARPFSG
ncbi:MAG: polysaccharide deacetylase family protein [Clostridia bacterium]